MRLCWLPRVIQTSENYASSRLAETISLCKKTAAVSLWIDDAVRCDSISDLLRARTPSLIVGSSTGQRQGAAASCFTFFSTVVIYDEPMSYKRIFLSFTERWASPITRSLLTMKMRNSVGCRASMINHVKVCRSIGCILGLIVSSQ